MSVKQWSYHFELSRSFLRLLPVFLLALSWSAPAEAGELCAQTDALPLGTTFRSDRGEGGCFRLDVPSAGLLALDASAPGSPEAEPRLVLMGGVRHRTTWETPRGAIVEVEEPGTFLVAVTPEDPARPPAGFKLRNAFADKAALLTELPGRDPGWAGSCPASAGAPQLATKDVDEEDCDIVEGVKTSRIGSPDVLGLCAAGPEGYGIDVHGDTPLCATPLELGRSAAGTLDNTAGDDEDFFTFVVDKLRSVRAGATAGHLTLYDGNGQRLVASAEGVEAPYLVRVLSPGRYYLRLQSLRDLGSQYVLSLEDFDEP